MKPGISVQLLQERREKARWRNQFNHQSTRTCERCRHFDSRVHKKLCERWLFLTQPGATCNRFSKPKSKLKRKDDASNA